LKLDVAYSKDVSRGSSLSFTIDSCQLGAMFTNKFILNLQYSAKYPAIFGFPLKGIIFSISREERSGRFGKLTHGHCLNYFGSTTVV
jgi:hypothetical protein